MRSANADDCPIEWGKDPHTAHSKIYFGTLAVYLFTKKEVRVSLKTINFNFNYLFFTVTKKLIPTSSLEKST